MLSFNIIKDYKVVEKKIIFQLDYEWSLKINFFEDNIIKISFKPNKEKNLESITMLSGKKIKSKNFTLINRGKVYSIETTNVKINLYQNPLCLKFYKKIKSKWILIKQDRPTGAWYWNQEENKTSHYQLRNNDQSIYGLGEKSGSIDRSFRRFVMSQKDTLGYNAEKSDPLYKSFPWIYVVDSKNREKDYGILYDQLSPSIIDLGSEHSNYHEPYRYYETQKKGIDLIIILKNSKKTIVSTLNDLIGNRYLPPKWSLGFQFSSMEIADHKNSRSLYLDFLNKCKKYNIPLSALHFSSGYSLHNNKRYVFIWNKKKFPDPKNFLKKLKQKGIYLVANLKPVLLKDHPFYEKAKKENLFINDKFNNPLLIQFWGGKGSFIDFLKKDSQTWWKKNIKKYILSQGFDAIWNDNNEYDLENFIGFSDLNRRKVATKNFISLQAYMMTKSSSEATQSFYPMIRNHGVTRSGSIGIQNHVETWTGDNKTSWHSLKWSMSISLGLSLSGIGLFGHDIGGFCGKKTEKELLIRSFQLMLFHPRFLMNSWKPGLNKQTSKQKSTDFLNKTNFPWNYKDSILEVSKIIKLRYEILPILYSAIWRYFNSGEPIVRPMFFDFPEKEHFNQEEVFSINERIIIAPILHKNTFKKNFFLPFCNEGWFDFFSKKFISCGGYVELEAPLYKIPILIRGGTLVPKLKFSLSKPHFAPIKEVEIYPSKTSKVFTQNNLPIIFDDGLTVNYKKGKNLILIPKININGKKIELSFIKKGKGKPQKEKIDLKLPKNLNIKLKNYSQIFKKN